MRRLRKLLALTRPERRLLVRAGLLLALIRLSLGRLPFTTLSRLVVGRQPAGRAASPGDARLADDVIWAVTAISRRTPGWTTCLTQALTVQAMLARRGLASRLHVGVVRGAQGQLEGHAWVERDGRILIGGSAPEVRRFVPLVAFDVEAGRRPAIGLQAER
jgi:hypothetical protein